MLQDRISAVIIVDKKILLVSDGSGIYWTPGGKLESGETHENALERELEEELKIKLNYSTKYIHYESIHQIQKEKHKVYCYLVNISGNIIPSSEITTYGWFSKDELPAVMKSIKEILIPKLIEDKLL